MENNNNNAKKRALAYGANSAFIIVLVLAIVGVINFLGARYPQKLDLTKNKVHTLSDQSKKLIKLLDKDLTFTFFGDFGGREKYKALLDNYAGLNPKLKLEWVQPNKEPARTKAAGVRKTDTLVIGYENRSAKVEDITEEKITNEIIKITKTNKTLVCAVLGHGEPSFTDSGAEGMSAAKKGLEEQAYDFKELTLAQQKKIPDECTVVVIMGPTKAIFPEEEKALSEYLNNGGRLVLGISAAVTGTDPAMEFSKVLSDWGFNLGKGLIIDPLSQIASVAIVALFAKDMAITKDFGQPPAFLPFARPMDLKTPLPDGLKGGWLIKSHGDTWDEMDMKSIAKGAVSFNKNIDIKGPIVIGSYIQGKKKDSKAPRETRIVALGSGAFVDNQFTRFGANLDLFLNSVSWAAEDESLVSIRAKEDTESKLEIDANQELIIKWLTIVIVPLCVAIAGIIIWMRRRKL